MEKNAVFPGRPRMSVQEQLRPDGPLYEMSLRFKCDAGLDEVDAFLEHMCMAEKPVLQNALMLRVVQTVPFVPDEDTIRKYEDTLAGTRSNGAMIRKARFDGYDYIYAVRPPDAQAPGAEERGDGQ